MAGTSFDGRGRFGMPGKPQLSAEDKAKLDASSVFGIGMEGIGSMNKQVLEKRQQALDATDPASTRIKEGANYQTRAAQATKAAQGGGNLSVGERSQIKRSAQADAGQQEYSNKAGALDKFSQSASNAAANTLGLIYGDKAANVRQPTQSGLTVICTELHRQGHLSSEIMVKDHNFGVDLRKNAPHIYEGYMTFAPSVVKLMKKSRRFTSFIAFFGVAWAKDMAGQKSNLGSFVNSIGMPVCGMIGKVFGGNCEKVHTA